MEMSGNTKKIAADARKEKKRNRHMVFVLCMVLIVAIAFVAGFVVRGQSSLMVALGIPMNEGTVATSPLGVPLKSTFDAVSPRLDEVENLLSENSMDSYDLDTATTSTLEAFANATEDEYLRYYDPARYDIYVKESSSGSYAGIGVLFAEYNGLAYVADVFEGSEAEAQGVRQGDYVVAIDGDRTSDWSLTETVKAVARDEGETIVITWLRTSSLNADKGEEFTTTLTCSQYSVPNVTTELSETVGYIRIKQFTQNAAELVSGAVNDLAAQGATSFVLDIRDNPGGYLTQAVDAADLFVTSGVIVEIQTKDGSTTKNANGTVITTAPIVVLVNEYTSAAAEVFTAALQDNQRAKVVGAKTLGKGSVQVVRELSFGGALRYTAAFYKTPLGHDINGMGVLPDIAVGMGGDAGTDPQKSLALETAASLVAA